MPAPYSMDFRQKIIFAFESEPRISQKALSSRFCVSESFISSLLLKYKKTGEFAPEPHGGGTPPIMNQKRISYLKEELASKCDRSLDELCELFTTKFSVPIHKSTMSENLRRYGLTRKKKLLFS